MTEGFIKLPRSLEKNLYWVDARPTHIRIFLAILSHSTFEKKEYNIQGNIITLEPLQLCATIRQILDWSGKWVSKNDVEGAIKYFKKVKFLRQEIRHGKTILTICNKEICEEFEKTSQTTSQTEVRHKVERREYKYKDSSKDSSLYFAESNKSDSQKEKIFFDFENKDWSGIQDSDLYRWKETYPAISISIELNKMREWCLSETNARSKKLWRKFINGWLNRANEKAVNFAAAKSSFKSNNQVDRRTKNPDGSPVSSPYDGAF